MLNIGQNEGGYMDYYDITFALELPLTVVPRVVTPRHSIITACMLLSPP